MSKEDKDSRTEEATSKRREDAFKEGTFARSADIGVVFVLSAAFVVLVFYAHTAASKVGILATQIFDHLGEYSFTQDGAVNFLIGQMQDAFFILLPLLLLSSIAAALAGGLQTGLKLTPNVLEAKLSKLNPIKGLQNIVSVKSLARATGDFFKFIAVGLIIWGAIKEITKHDIFGSPVAVGVIGEFILDTFVFMLIKLILALGVIAIIGYLYQRHRVSKDLMMTKQEVKDEHKDYEGNPLTRSAQRAMAKRVMQRQMLDDVPLADVVVTNPTHYAIALKYESGKDLAPLVLAKGENMFAKRIKEIAAEHNVPTVENKPVARVLYKIGEVGKAVPPQLYQVIAEILSEVYRTHKYYFHRLKARRQEAAQK